MPRPLFFSPIFSFSFLNRFLLKQPGIERHLVSPSLQRSHGNFIPFPLAIMDQYSIYDHYCDPARDEWVRVPSPHPVTSWVSSLNLSFSTTFSAPKTVYLSERMVVADNNHRRLWIILDHHVSFPLAPAVICSPRNALTLNPMAPPYNSTSGFTELTPPPGRGQDPSPRSGDFAIVDSHSTLHPQTQRGPGHGLTRQPTPSEASGTTHTTRSSHVSHPPKAKPPNHPNNVTNSYHPTPKQFSLQNLSATHPLRRVRASTVRAQANAMPSEVQDPPNYPHRFYNGERLPFAHNEHQLIEYPLMPEGWPAWRPGPWADPGPARIVVEDMNRERPEVMYHDPEQDGRGGARGRPFVAAVYWGRGERRGGAV